MSETCAQTRLPKTVHVHENGPMPFPHERMNDIPVKSEFHAQEAIRADMLTRYRKIA